MTQNKLVKNINMTKAKNRIYNNYHLDHQCLKKKLLLKMSLDTQLKKGQPKVLTTNLSKPMSFLASNTQAIETATKKFQKEKKKK